MKKTNRTVVALLDTKMKEVFGRFKYRNQPRHTYIYCRSTNIAHLFLQNAEAEGFTFGDGMLPTEKDVSDIYAIYPDYTISYTGWAGYILFKNGKGNVVRIDYGKYISGAKDWIG